MSCYEEACAGCRLSQGHGCVPGGTLPFGQGWLLNHYTGQEGYLGWMALQPLCHRMSFTELSEKELCTLGPTIKSIHQLLAEYWSETFPDDELLRVYVVYFFESVFNTPKASPYHLHMHLIPRPRSLELPLREYRDGKVDCEFATTINAWNTPRITMQRAFPDRYRRMKNDENYEALMRLRTRVQAEG